MDIWDIEIDSKFVQTHLRCSDAFYRLGNRCVAVLGANTGHRFMIIDYRMYKRHILEMPTDARHQHTT